MPTPFFLFAFLVQIYSIQLLIYAALYLDSGFIYLASKSILFNETFLIFTIRTAYKIMRNFNKYIFGKKEKKM